MEVRKDLVKKLKKLNKKASKQGLPFHLRFFETIKEHKKKTLFFLVAGGLAIYYEYYLKVIRYFRTMEPMKLKLRRWFLGEERFVPESIKETLILEEGLHLKPDTIIVLSEYFTKTDKEFAYGITRKFLKKVFVKAGCLTNEEEIKGFYNEGPYRRRLNQRVSGVNLKQFLLLFEKALKKLRKNDPTFTEEELLRRILSNWEESKERVLKWEEKLVEMRPELRKAASVFEEDKRKILMLKLKEDPDIPTEELDRELARSGFYGLGLKDKLLTLEYQLMYWEVTKSYYVNKLAKEVIPGKTMKLEDKIKKLEEKIHNKRADLERFKTQFEDIFKRKKLAEGELQKEGEAKSE